MKIFRNLALALLSVSLLSPSAAFAGKGKKKASLEAPVVVPHYARVIVDTQDYAWPVPLPLDPNHTGMIASGLYTQTQANQLDQDAADEFLALYGVDFDPVRNSPNVTVLSDGRRAVTGFPAVWFPYISENQAFVVSDSLNPKRGTSQDWVNNKYGVQILFTGPAPTVDCPTNTTQTGLVLPANQFTDGINENAYYRLNNLFSYGYFNYLRMGKTGNDRLKCKNREVVTYTTNNLSYSTPNQWALPNTTPITPGQFTVTLKVIDSCGNEGKYIGTTEVYKEPIATGPYFLRENPVSTWRNLNNGKPGCDKHDNPECSN